MKCHNVRAIKKLTIKGVIFMHSKVLRMMVKKVVLEYLSRVKNSKDSLKLIYMMKNAPSKYLVLTKNKATKPHIEDSTSLTQKIPNIRMKLY